MASSSASTLDFDMSLVALLSSYVGSDMPAVQQATDTVSTSAPDDAAQALPAPFALPCDAHAGARGHTGDESPTAKILAGGGRVQGRRRSTPSIYRWHRLEPGPGPATRGRHTVGVDAAHGTLVMFGGQNYDLRRKYNDVVKFDLQAERWVSVEDPSVPDEEVPQPLSSASHATPNVPCARSSHASVATAEALYIFGGATGKSFAASPGCCSDASTWRYAFDSGTWSKVEAPGLDALSSRYGHTTVLAPGDVVYLFGGMTDAGCDWNTYRVDLRSLTVERLECSFVGTAGDVCGPFPESGAGHDGTPPFPFPTAPAPPAPASAPPPPAGGPVSSPGQSPYDAALPAGFTPSGFDTSTPPPAPAHAPFRHRKTAQQVRDCVRGFGHTAIYNPHTDSMYVLGGTVDGRRYHTTFLRLDLKTRRWMLEESVNAAPEGRYVHCASYDERRNAMYVFGGYCGSYRNDVHEYDFNTRRWTEIKPHPLFPEGPSFRSGACSVVWRDHIYIFGGCDDTTYYNDVWKLRLYNDTISLKETMLEWVAWQQAKGTMLVTDAHAPAPLVKQLVSKEVEYKLLCPKPKPLWQRRHARLSYRDPRPVPPCPEASSPDPAGKAEGDDDDDDDDDMHISGEFASPLESE